jgi:hypothetical protein
MARSTIETAREWAPKPIRDRLPGGRRTGLSARLPARWSRIRLLDTSEAAMRRRRRQRRMRARARSARSMPWLSMPSVSMPSVSMPSVSMPSMPSVSMPSMPSVSMPSMPKRARRRRSRRMAGNLGLLVGAAAGYVLGTKAGRERYQQIVEQAHQLWERPQVRDTLAKGRDRVGSGVERAAATAGDRLHHARERSSEPAPSRNGPSRSTSGAGPGTGPGATGGLA